MEGSILFKMLSKLVFLSREREESDDIENTNAPDLFAGAASNWRNTENENSVETDFRPYLLEQFDTMVLNFIANMSPILREIKRHEEDASFAATINTALGNRVRVDTASQGLTTTQQANARANINAYGPVELGDPTVDYLAIFNSGLN